MNLHIFRQAHALSWLSERPHRSALPSDPSPTVAAVFVTGASIVYSASDLAAAARCEYTLLRDLDAKLGWGPAVDVEDELLARTAALGTEHERRRLDQLRDEFGDAVAVIGRPTHTVARLTAAAEATQRAVASRAPVVYWAAMFDECFVRFARVSSVEFLFSACAPNPQRLLNEPCGVVTYRAEARSA